MRAVRWLLSNTIGAAQLSRVAAAIVLAPVLAAAQSLGNPAIDRVFGEWDKPGSPGCALGVVRDASGAIITDCGTGQLVSTTTDQEIVEVCLSGGSGFGSPFERPLAAIARDLAEGYISREAAVRDYGVAVGADGKLDMAQSARRREPGTAAE